MEIFKIIALILVLAVGVAYFISLVLMLVGRLIKLLGFKDDAPAPIPGTPAGQIMPPAHSDQTAIAIAIAAAKRKSLNK